MKKLVIITLLFASSRVLGQRPFVLEGEMPGRDSGLIYLSYVGEGKDLVNDSSGINHGYFRFSGSIKGPEEAVLHFSSVPDFSENGRVKRWYIEPGQIKILVKDTDLSAGVVSGSLTQAESDSLDSQVDSIQKEGEGLSREFDRHNRQYMDAVKRKESDHVLDSIKEILNADHERYDLLYSSRERAAIFQFIAAHPDSYVSAVQLGNYSPFLSLDSLKLLFSPLSAYLKESAYGVQIVRGIKKREAAAIGSMAADFTTKDINGTSLSLSDFKGKYYVILDFWASWCVPCRHSNPHMRALYRQYHGKGLDVIGVSDDDGNEAAWKKAVAQDSVGIWHNILRGYSAKTPYGEDGPTDINEKFGIAFLPTKILIDKNGVIIGRYGEADEVALDKKLTEVLNK